MNYVDINFRIIWKAEGNLDIKIQYPLTSMDNDFRFQISELTNIPVMQAMRTLPCPFRVHLQDPTLKVSKYTTFTTVW